MRVNWVSEDARVVWGHRFRAAALAWAAVEFRAVEVGLRSHAILALSGEQYFALVERTSGSGLVVNHVRNILREDRYIAFDALPWRQGSPLTAIVVVSARRRADEMLAAHAAGDQRRIGELLGYPECCIDAFERDAAAGYLVDNTCGIIQRETENRGRVAIVRNSLANPLLRWLGVRAVPHLPCGLACDRSVVMAEGFLEVGRQAGLNDEMEWLSEICRWPIEWSMRNGIVEIRTPVVKICFDAGGPRGSWKLMALGDGVPPERGRGVMFPYAGLYQSSTGGGVPKASAPLGGGEPYANGFGSWEAMTEAHATLIKAVSEHRRNVRLESVLDLGCGDGRLVFGIATLAGAVPFGVESNQERAGTAKALLGTLGGVVWNEDLRSVGPWSKRRFGMVVVAIERFMEADEMQLAKLRAALQVSASKICLYSYDGKSDGEDIGEKFKLGEVVGGFGSSWCRGQIIEPAPVS